MAYVARPASPGLMGDCRARMLACKRTLDWFRTRLATETDAAIVTVLTHLWDKEAERSAIAIQKEIDKEKTDAPSKATPPTKVGSLRTTFRED